MSKMSNTKRLFLTNVKIDNYLFFVNLFPRFFYTRLRSTRLPESEMSKHGLGRFIIGRVGQTG
jgi:hypothetical protein